MLRLLCLSGLLYVLCLPALAADEPSGSAPPAATVLPTGVRITPQAASGAQLAELDPGLTRYPHLRAGNAVSSALSPDGSHWLVLTSGYNRYQDKTGKTDAAASNEWVFVYDVRNDAPQLSQVLPVPNAFCGLAWNPRGNEFYVSGGVDDTVHRFMFANGKWVEHQPAIALGHASGLGIHVRPMAAGVAVNPDGTRLLVANLENDSLSEIDLVAGKLLRERDLRPGRNNPGQSGVPGGEYPYWPIYLSDQRAAVTSLRDREVVLLNTGDTLTVAGRIRVGGQPERLVASHDGRRLYVVNSGSDSISVIDTQRTTVIDTLPTSAPATTFANARQLTGSNPNALALSPDEHTLYVSNGGTNAIAVVSLSPPAGVRGLIPTGWYPDSLDIGPDGKRLYVVNAKGEPGANPGGCRDTLSTAHDAQDSCRARNQYVLQRTHSSILTLPVPGAAALAQLTRQVSRNNHWADAQDARAVWAVMRHVRTRIHHVIYVVKENRTYDQVLGDLRPGNGDAALVLLPEALTPNHHALAHEFVTLDNFLDSGSVSGDGWMWSTAARTSDYAEKDIPILYAGRGLSYDTEGENRNLDLGLASPAERRREQPDTPDDDDLLPGHADVAAPDGPGGAPGAGYLWDAALRAGLTLRNYGFFVTNDNDGETVAPSTRPYADHQPQAHANSAALRPYTDRYYRGFDLKYADYWRYREWAREFADYERHGNLPTLELVRLPHDHFGEFSAARDGVNTVETQMSDNDYALGLLVQAVSRSRYRNDTLIVVVEDDAQNGADHVDAHRSPAYLIGAMIKRHTVVSTRYTTVNLLRTIEAVLGLQPMGLTDAHALPMCDAFSENSQPFDYRVRVPQSLHTTRLPLPPTRAARSAVSAAAGLSRPLHDSHYWSTAMQGQDFSAEDRLDTARFNQALWQGLAPIVRSTPQHD